jgi:hypothetical protein
MHLPIILLIEKSDFYYLYGSMEQIILKFSENARLADAELLDESLIKAIRIVEEKFKSDEDVERILVL